MLSFRQDDAGGRLPDPALTEDQNQVHGRRPVLAIKTDREGTDVNRLNEVLKGKQDNYILPFFWQHGEEEETLRHYMRVIKDANIGAVCVESRPHPDFCGEKWWKDMDVILEEAEKSGMMVWLLVASHCPTGFAHGAVDDAPSVLTHQYMLYRSQ